MDTSWPLIGWVGEAACFLLHPITLTATLIPTLAVPVVLLGTFGILAAFGYSINTLTMFGVVLAIVGLIVVRALFLEQALDQFYKANLIAKVDYADILYYVAPWLIVTGVAMAAITSYVTLRLYVRK